MTSVTISQVGTNFITISWTRPEYVPINFQTTISCHLLCDLEPYPIKDEVTISPSHVNQNNIEGLLPGSNCDISFLARYNPATLDPGIKLKAFTTSSRMNIFEACFYSYELCSDI